MLRALGGPQPVFGKCLTKLCTWFCVPLTCFLCLPASAARIKLPAAHALFLQTSSTPQSPVPKAPKAKTPAVQAKEPAKSPAAVSNTNGANPSSPPSAAGKPATPPPTTKKKTPLPPTPAIVVRGDFRSLLKSSGKAATPAELKTLLAFLTSDKGISYSTVIKNLAPSIVFVTNTVPAGETPVSLIIASTVEGTMPVEVQVSNSEVLQSVSLGGDFSPVSFDSAHPSECPPMDACAVLLAKDGQTIIGEVTGLRLNPRSSAEILVTYKGPISPVPGFIRIWKKDRPPLTFAFVPVKASDTKEEIVEMRQVIAGDFCQKNDNGDCTTEFLKPDEQSIDTCPKGPAGQHSASNPICHVTAAYILDTGDSKFRPALIGQLGADTADITFNAPSNFKPAYLAVDTKYQSYRFAYTPAPSVHSSDLNYESDELSTVCDQVRDPLDATKGIPDCDNTPPGRWSLKSLSNGNELAYVGMQGNLIIARVTAVLGQEPAAIIVSNKTTKKSTIARRTIKPGEDTNLLNVNMTIIDQVTAQRNYGNRIAKRYIAVNLDVTNPTATKVQFNKSALYFDVDYVEAKEQGLTRTGFFQSVAEVSTLGLYQPSVYSAPFVAGRKDKKTPRVARFGLEQNVKNSPENYLSILGSFDYTTEKTDEKLKALELVGSILTNIATGGVVADASGAFRAGTALFSGTFLPGVRGLVLDTSFINRLRSNLVAQTLQETIQVPAKGSTATIVLLPRTGILAFTDAEVPVMIKRVIDVHLVEEVVTPATQTGVKKNECTVGNTEDQARQALGEPTGKTTNPDGSSVFTFSKGPVASVDFNTKGVLVSCKTRTSTEQMDLAKTLVEAKQTLTDLGITASLIELTDSSTVIVDIPGVQKTYHFDAKGAITSDYTFLFKDITSQEDKAQAVLEAFLENKATPLSATRASVISGEAKIQGSAKAGSTSHYHSPDIQNGTVTVTFKNNGAGKSASVVIDKITFQGDKPKGID